MLAWSEGTGDNGRQKARNHGYDDHCRPESYLQLLDHLANLSHKPKTQINRRRTLQLLSRWWDAYRKQLGLKTSLRKSRDCGITAD